MKSLDFPVLGKREAQRTGSSPVCFCGFLQSLWVSKVLISSSVSTDVSSACDDKNTSEVSEGINL